MEDVADDGAGGRRDDADDGRQVWQRLLARLVEQALRRELTLALFKERHERAETGRRQGLDDDLVGRAARIRREPAGGDDLKPFLGSDAHAGERGLPDDRVD